MIDDLWLSCLIDVLVVDFFDRCLVVNLFKRCLVVVLFERSFIYINSLYRIVYPILYKAYIFMNYQNYIP